MAEMTIHDAITLAGRLTREGRLAEAETLFIQIISAQPKWGDGHAQFADLLVAANKTDLAIAALQNALVNRPSNPSQCLTNLSVLLYQSQRYPQAADACRQAIALQPGNALLHQNLGDALSKLGQHAEAEQEFCTAMQLDPQLQELHINIGLTFYHRNRFAEALHEFQLRLQSDPANLSACFNAVLCLGRLGDREATETFLRKAIALSPEEPQLTSCLIMILNYTRGHDPKYMLDQSRAYDRRHATAVRQASRAADIDLNPDRPLRIGYISPDFRHHSVSFFLEPLILRHSRDQVTIACYAEVENPDEKTALYQKHSDRWRSIIGLDDDAVAAQIAADRIDILIDLAGHTSSNRLSVFARKPAPIQITWLGYPNTTGMSAIDYRLTDIHADPTGAESFYSEKLVRLPDAFFVYQPPESVPPVAPLPMLTAGHVTFASLNNISKITPEISACWADILRAVPGSRLLICAAAYDAEARLKAMLPGIDPACIEVFDTMKLDDYFRLFERIDIALDTFPWAGHTTSLHSLWMGIPVVSLAGPTAVSRAGVSVMKPLGLDRDWIAEDFAGYRDLAVGWANRPEALADLRSRLRPMLANSVLMNADRFTLNFENQLREFWRAFCSRQSPRSL